jgi:ribosomal protein L30E
MFMNSGSRTPTRVTMIFSLRLLSTSSHVRRVVKGFQPNKVFFNASHAHEAVEDRNAACLVVCSACPATTKWLLAYYSARTLFVVVYVPSGVTKFVGCLDQSLALGGKAGRFSGR